MPLTALIVSEKRRAKKLKKSEKNSRKVCFMWADPSFEKNSRKVCFMWADPSFLHAKLRKMHSISTYKDILDIDSEEFRLTKGIGINKYYQLLDWKISIKDNPPHIIMDEDLNNYRINFSHLNKNEKALINKFLRRGITIDKITPLFIMNQSPFDLTLQTGFGRKSGIALAEIQKNIKSHILESSNEAGFLIPLDFGKEYSLTEIGLTVLHDIEHFIQLLSNEQTIIFTRRIGFGEKFWTLDKLGERIGVTRERVRQKEKEIIFDLVNSVTIAPHIIASKIEDLPASSVITEVLALREAFTSDELCIRMLARLAHIDARKILRNSPPLIPQTTLD
jgi:hypothetical protein